MVVAAGEKGPQLELDRARGAFELIGDGQRVPAVDEGQLFAQDEVCADIGPRRNRLERER